MPRLDVALHCTKIQGKASQLISCNFHLLQYNLGDDERSFHTRAAVGLTVVGVRARSVELPSKGLTLFAELLIHRDCLLRHAIRDAVLVEDNIVWATLIVDPSDGVALANRNLRRDERQQSRIAPHLNLLRLGGIRRRVDGSDGHSRRQTGSACHRRAAGAVIVRPDDGVQVVVEFLPIHSRREGGLVVLLERPHHWCHAEAAVTHAAAVPGGALRAGKQREELALAPLDD
mmetsp:Transcript_46192/g.55981  ORF Transcript_46192/g.55981 Transcript_46192/m.55981 type:complete len:231 (+) Transcript_46192:164-856(+)